MSLHVQSGKRAGLSMSLLLQVLNTTDVVTVTQALC